MSTWFPEKPPDDEFPDRSGRPLFRGERADTPTQASGESHALPTRRSAHAATSQEAYPGRGGSTQSEDTQFMPPFTEGEEESGDTGRQGLPFYPGESAGGSLYESSRRPTPSGGGRRAAGGPSTPPYQDLAPSPPPFQDPVPGPSSGAPPGAPYGEHPSGLAGYPGPHPAGPAGPQAAEQPGPGPGEGSRQPLALPLTGADPSAGRSRGAEPYGGAPGQSLSRVLAALAWPVVAFGLFLPESGQSVFHRTPAWSAFSLLCLVLVGVGAFGGAQGPGSGRTFTLGVIGAGGLVAFWVLLVLPEIHLNTSFALTLGTTLAAFAMWLTSGRRRG